jgi:GNAT superfamily N-acetyltransferase
VLVETWVNAWALARRFPAPVRVPGGLRVNLGTDQERVRLVLFDADAGVIRDFLSAETSAGAVLKVCAEAATVEPFLPAGWKLHQPQHLMTASLPAPLPRTAELPPEYVMSSRVEGALIWCEVEDRAGRIAASGRLITRGRYAIVDDVETAPEHRRRGFGTMVVARLMSIGREAGAVTGLLVATAAGHRLYTALGWRVHAPYTSAYQDDNAPLSKRA